MSYEFRKFDGDYVKTFYDVRLPDGTIIEECWPNAGKMCAMDGSNMKWTVEDDIEVKVSDCEY